MPKDSNEGLYFQEVAAIRALCPGCNGGTLAELFPGIPVYGKNRETPGKGSLMPQKQYDPQTRQAVNRTKAKMTRWGITLTFLATELGVSRQYVWQAVNGRIPLSAEKAREIERAVDTIISRRSHLTSFGARLRAARISAGLTLKQVAPMIGYSWVGIERWEKDICVPKPGVLWHLLSVYGVNGDLFAPFPLSVQPLKRAS